MSIKWNALAEHEKSKFEKMSEAQRFIYFLLKQFGSPYGWGKENPVSSDCSGAVCMALYAATGLLIRTTADDLLKRVFTKINPRQGEIRAVFYVTKKDKKHGDGYAAAGTAIHVAGFIDDGVILNSQEPYARVRHITEVSDRFQKEGHEVLIRGLNREALERLAREGKTTYELDSEFWNFFEKGMGSRE
jgi:murein DD-endopeptidase